MAKIQSVGRPWTPLEDLNIRGNSSTPQTVDCSKVLPVTGPEHGGDPATFATAQTLTQRLVAYPAQLIDLLSSMHLLNHP